MPTSRRSESDSSSYYMYHWLQKETFCISGDVVDMQVLDSAVNHFVVQNRTHGANNATQMAARSFVHGHTNMSFLWAGCDLPPICPP